MTTTPSTHPVDEVLPVGQLVTYGLQHVLSMYAGIIAVPLVVGGALKLSTADQTYILASTLLVCGLATLLQTLGVWRVGARLPLVQGISFAPVATMIVIGLNAGGGRGGLRAVYGAVIVAGVLGVLLSPFFSKLLALFPPVVTGTVITLIGISLLPVAMAWAAGGTGAKDFGATKNLAMALATLLVVLAIYRFLPGFLNRAAVLLGLVVMTVVAIPFGFNGFSAVKDAHVVGFPVPFHFGAPTFGVGACLTMLVAMLVIMTETTADLLAVGEITGRPQDDRSIASGLAADTLSTAVAGCWNTFPCTAFAQNVGLVAVTGVRSRFVVAAGGFLLVLMGLFPVVGALAGAIPLPVLGGAGIVLFGSVASSGIRTLSKVEYEGNANLTVVAVALGIGLIPIGVPTFYDHVPRTLATVLGSGISAGAITAVLLNLLFNTRGAQPAEQAAPLYAASQPVGLVVEDEASTSV